MIFGKIQGWWPEIYEPNAAANGQSSQIGGREDLAGTIAERAAAGLSSDMS